MAEESMLDKAIALIPGVSPAKKRRSSAASAAATRRKQLATVKANLAKLARDVQKLATMLGGEGKKAAPAKRRAVAKTSVTRKTSARKTVRKAPRKKR